MKQQIGRSVHHVERRSKYDTKLSWFRSLKDIYFHFRIALLEGRIKKYGSFADYRTDLCNAAIYEKQAYLYKVEALYSKQALRDYERRVSRGEFK